MREAADDDEVHVRYGPQSLHWQYVEEIADMASVALASSRRRTGKTYNAFGDTRSWHDTAQSSKLCVLHFV